MYLTKNIKIIETKLIELKEERHNLTIAGEPNALLSVIKRKNRLKIVKKMEHYRNITFF